MMASDEPVVAVPMADLWSEGGACQRSAIIDCASAGLAATLLLGTCSGRRRRGIRGCDKMKRVATHNAALVDIACGRILILIDEILHGQLNWVQATGNS